MTKTRQLVDELQKRKHDDKLRHEIRTNLTSITWDIQDLEETISIAAQNPAKFNLSQADIESRRQFIAQTTEFVEKTKRANNIDLDVKSAEQTSKADSASVTFNDVKPSVATSGGTSKYTRLVDGDDPDAGSKSANQFGSRQNQDNSNNGSHTLQMQHSVIARLTFGFNVAFRIAFLIVHTTTTTITKGNIQRAREESGSDKFARDQLEEHQPVDAQRARRSGRAAR